MTLKRAYYMLAGFYTLILAIGVVAILSGGGSPLALAHLSLGALAVLGLWGYILQRGFMSPRIWRPFAGVLAVGVIVQVGVVLSMSVSNVELTWMLISSIFSVMLVILLFQYGNRDQPLWATRAEVNSARELKALLQKDVSLVATNRDGERENRVNISNVGGEYLARVTRRTGNDQETFEQHFKYPETLVFFIEKFASISVHDFKQRPTA